MKVSSLPRCDGINGGRTKFSLIPTLKSRYMGSSVMTRFPIFASLLEAIALVGGEKNSSISSNPVDDETKRDDAPIGNVPSFVSLNGPRCLARAPAFTSRRLPLGANSSKVCRRVIGIRVGR
jgi:hypothetical protein